MSKVGIAQAGCVFLCARTELSNANNNLYHIVHKRVNSFKSQLNDSRALPSPRCFSHIPSQYCAAAPTPPKAVLAAVKALSRNSSSDLMIGNTFGPNCASSSSKVYKSQSAISLFAAKLTRSRRHSYLIDLELLPDDLYQLPPLRLIEQRRFLRQSEQKADVFRHELCKPNISKAGSRLNDGGRHTE